MYRQAALMAAGQHIRCNMDAIHDTMKQREWKTERSIDEVNDVYNDAAPHFTRIDDF